MVTTEQKALMRPVQLDDKQLVFDFETTGLSKHDAEIVEMAAMVIDAMGNVHGSFETLVNPEIDIPYAATEIHGITNEMVKDAPTIMNAIHDFFQFVLKHDVKLWWAHNPGFDLGFFVKATGRGLMLPDLEFVCLNTVELARAAWPHAENHKLQTLLKMCRVYLPESHRAMWDVAGTATLIGLAFEDLGILENKKTTSLAKALKGRVTSLWKYRNGKLVQGTL